MTRKEFISVCYKTANGFINPDRISVVYDKLMEEAGLPPLENMWWNLLGYVTMNPIYNLRFDLKNQNVGDIANDYMDRINAKISEKKEKW